RWRGGGGRARGRLRACHAGAPVHALQEVLHHHVPDPDDDRADRGRVQFLDDLHRQRPPQPAAGAVSGADRHRSAHPLAVRPGGGAARHHHSRHLPLALPYLPVRLPGPAPQLIDAPRVMGATPLQIFWRVQLPLLKPAIVIAVIIRSMEALKMFDPVVLLTFGGPGTSTQTVAYFLWEQV